MHILLWWLYAGLLFHVKIDFLLLFLYLPAITLIHNRNFRRHHRSCNRSPRAEPAVQDQIFVYHLSYECDLILLSPVKKRNVTKQKDSTIPCFDFSFSSFFLIFYSAIENNKWSIFPQLGGANIVSFFSDFFSDFSPKKRCFFFVACNRKVSCDFLMIL